MIELKEKPYGSTLPTNYTSPFIKGQVIALDYGELGNKFSPKYLEGEYSENRLWAVISIPEYNNLADAQMLMVPLSSLCTKYKEYILKDLDGSKRSVPTKGVKDSKVYVQTDRIAFNAYGELVLLMMTHMKSFSVDDVINHFRHVYFLPEAVMRCVDNFIAQFTGIAEEKTEQINKLGSTNRMGYKVKYNKEELGIPLTTTSTSRTNNNFYPNLSNVEEYRSKKKVESKPVQEPVIIEQPEQPIAHKDTHGVAISKDDIAFKYSILEYFSENKIDMGEYITEAMTQISNRGESVESIRSKFSSLLDKGVNKTFKAKFGFELINISQYEISSAVVALGLTSNKKRKKVLIKAADAIRIYSHIVNDRGYLNKVLGTLSRSTLEEIYNNFSKKEMDIINTDKPLTREEVNSLLENHISRKRMRWTVQEADTFLTLYWLASENGWKAKFATYFHFGVSDQATYLSKKFGFKLKKSKKEECKKLLVGYNPPPYDIQECFRKDYASVAISDEIMCKKYGVKKEDLKTLNLAFMDVLNPAV